MAIRDHARNGLRVLWTDPDRLRHDRPVNADAPRLQVVPQTSDDSLVREAFRELHELADPAAETPQGYDRDPRRWHPSMGARLAAVR
jgi:hypothetical protein